MASAPGTAQKKIFFTTQLLEWAQHENKRQLPWKEEKDPYRIWLSEIILQQTRAEQGRPYYERFIATYPTLKDLAAAPDDDVFRLWQGLGYYNRCRNMLETARYLVAENAGKFPESFEELLALKGIGSYTAAAIASFAFGRPHAVVDGNVIRVLARVFAIETPFDTTAGKKEFQQLATSLLAKETPALFNQAIMDLGATICLPLSPVCGACPERKICTAFQEGRINLLPVRSKKQPVKQRFFHYLILQWEGTIWLHRRGPADIWQNLYEPYLIEAGTALDSKALLLQESVQALSLQGPLSFAGSLRQRLTHQQLEIRFFIAELSAKPQMAGADGQWVPVQQLGRLAFPRSLVSFFQKNHYF